MQSNLKDTRKILQLTKTKSEKKQERHGGKKVGGKKVLRLINSGSGEGGNRFRQSCLTVLLGKYFPPHASGHVLNRNEAALHHSTHPRNRLSLVVTDL